MKFILLLRSDKAYQFLIDKKKLNFPFNKICKAVKSDGDDNNKI